MLIRTLGLAAALTAAALPAYAAEITVSDAFARETPPTAKVGGAFMTFQNAGGDDRLIAASSPAAERVELHEHSMDSEGVMRMREVEGGIALPAGETVTLEPGGLHIMLMGLTAPLKKGESVHLDLEFESGHAQSVMIPVMEIGSMGHDGHSGGRDMNHSSGN